MSGPSYCAKTRARSLEELKNFPFVNDAMVAALATELPLYIAAADGLACNNEKEKLTWWAAHQDTLPQWSALVRKVLLVQPSSASAERVFSLTARGSARGLHRGICDGQIQ